MKYSWPIPTSFDLQKLLIKLSLVERNHYIAGHVRHENDIEHSFAVAMLCWQIHEQNNLKLDLKKIMQYAMVHDFVESYAGDTNTFASKSERDNKARSEKLALQRLSKEFAEFKGMVKTMKDYELKTDAEALFVWSVDKIQALIMADLDKWRPYQDIGISYDRFVEKHTEHLNLCSPYCKEIFESLLEYCKTTYYDKPKTVRT